VFRNAVYLSPVLLIAVLVVLALYSPPSEPPSPPPNPPSEVPEPPPEEPGPEEPEPPEDERIPVSHRIEHEDS